MNPTRAIIMSVGLVTVVVGAYLFYFQAELSRWVSLGLVTAGIVVFAGIAVMMFAGGGRSDPVAAAPATTVAAQPTTVVQDNRPAHGRQSR